MRGFVLLLLGGGLVWWIWSGLGSPEAREPEREPTVAELEEAALPPPGRMLTPPPRPEPERVQTLSEPTSAEARLPLTRPRTETIQPDPQRASEREQGRDPLPAAGFEDTLAIAECLLHRPHELPQTLAAQGDAVSQDRQRLVLAYAHAIAGRLGRAHDLAAGLEGSRDVSSAEWDLCRALIAEDSTVRPISASHTARSPLVLAATMAWNANEADRWLKSGAFHRAATTFSDLLLEEIRAPWAADRATLEAWIDGLTRSQQRHRWNRDGEWPAIDVTVEPGDSLVVIRKRVIDSRPDMLLCTGLIARANELRGSVIHPGDTLRIPTDRAHALVDLDARTTYYMLGDEVVAAWIVGIGRAGSETRPGTYTIGDKQVDPMWFRPGQDPVPHGDPENLLGTRWLGWEEAGGQESSLGFHGTNAPEGVGGAVSAGCIRMQNRDVEELFEILPKGATVIVQP